MLHMHIAVIAIAAGLISMYAHTPAPRPGSRRCRGYVGTYTGPNSAGIHLVEFDTETGELSYLSLAAETANPTFLALHPTVPIVYAAGENYGATGGTLTAFAISPQDGKLQQISQQPSGGKGPCHLTLDATGRCILVANYGNGTFQASSVQPDGKLAPNATIIRHQGSGPNKRRQEGPHAHGIYPDPTNRYALAIDLGTDEIVVYPLDAANGAISQTRAAVGKTAPGAGPRHLVISADGRFVYVTNELDNTVVVFAWDATKPSLTAIQTLPTLPTDFTGESTTAEIDLHPNGKTLYVSNRGHESIAAFRVDPATGKLSPLAPLSHQSTEGAHPRHFAVDPTGQWMLVANQQTNSLVVLKITESGTLQSTGRKLDIPAAVCTLFVPC